jgi:hypothetical protein
LLQGVLQAMPALQVAEEIQIELTPHERDVLKGVKAVNPETYVAYSKGRYFWNKRTSDRMKKAIDYFSEDLEAKKTSAEADLDRTIQDPAFDVKL